MWLGSGVAVVKAGGLGTFISLGCGPKKKEKKKKKTGPGKMPKIDYSSKNIKLQTNRERVGLFLF